MSTLTSKKAAEFDKEFPFLYKLIPLRQTQYDGIAKLEISVQIADSSMLYTTPSFCLHPHYIRTTDNKFIGHKRPFVYVIGKDDSTIQRAQWDYDHNDFFIKDVMGKGNNVKMVVLVICYIWCHNIEDWFEKGLNTPVGEFSHYQYCTTIFKAPKKGFTDLVERSKLTSNVRITDLVRIGLASRENPEAKAAINVLGNLVRSFEKNVAQSLWKSVNKCRTHGMSATYGGTKMMVYAIAGRVMITFQRGEDQFTVVGDDSDYTRTGLQSMNCTVDTAKAMVQDVINHWKNIILLPEKSVKSDTNIFMV